MHISLNQDQSKALSGFFFDVSKGLVIGGVGFSAVAPLEAKLIVIAITLAVAFWCIRLGLSFLE